MGGAFILAAIVCIVIGAYISRDIWTPGAVDADMDRDKMAGGMILFLMCNVFTAISNNFVDNFFGEFGFWFSLFACVIAVIALMKWAPPPTEYGELV